MTIHYLPGRGFDSNLYVIDGRDPILIDTGTRPYAEAVLRRLSEIVDLRKLRRIVLTHMHYDHVGGASYLKQKLSAQVFIHELDADPVRKGDRWATFSNGFGEKMDALDVSSVHQGEKFSTGEHELKVLHTPGHTQGSICLLETSSGELISGDTVFVGGVGRWDLPGGDYDKLIGSIRTLYALAPTSIYPGHGPCGIGNGKEQIAEALSCLGES